MIINKSTIISSRRGEGIMFFVLIMLFLQCSFVFAASTSTVDELKGQIQKITDTKVQLEKEIAVYEAQIKDLGVQTVSLKNTIKSLDATINKNALNIKLTENKISSTQLEIEQLSLNIDKNIVIINNNTEAIAGFIKEVASIENNTFIENFFIYNNLSEMWNNLQQVYIIQNSIREKVVETKNTKTILENNKIVAEHKKQDLLKLKSSLVDSKKLLDISKSEKNKLLADTKNSETTYKKMLAEKQAMSDAFDQELLKFESQLKFTMNASSIPSAIKGILSWPLASILVTSPFGMRWGKMHNGVDFKASIGTKVMAASGGIVKGTGDTDTICRGASFGKWVFIEHGDGLSTIYAHLSLIKVNVGQTLNAGDIIGYSGNTGFSTGPHLHFGVFATQGVKIMSFKSSVCSGTYMMPVADSKAYLNPMIYLPTL